MGLDMNAYSRPPGGIHEDRELAYWRKHNSLHGWMTKLAIERKVVKKGDEFNCIDLQLSLADLEKLEGVVQREELICTEGFFFGGDYEAAMFKAVDLRFIEKAKKEIKEGYQIYYSSNW